MQWSIEPVEPGSPEYLAAKDLRYRALYGPWDLPRDLIEDTDGRTYRHLAAVLDGDLVGYGRIHLEVDPPQIYQVCVAEQWRKRGIGEEIMNVLMRIAHEHGADEVTLDARDYAVGFYERLGFEPYGEVFISGRTQTPHQKMRKRL